MKLEQQVCSLESAKRLKELGVKQESMFGWTRIGDKYELRYFEDIKGYRDYSAFTVAEFGVMLPPHYFTTKSQDIENHWHCNSIENFMDDDFKKGIIENTEAEARAKMLIYLLENKLI